jgi:N-methylhydantoinase A
MLLADIVKDYSLTVMLSQDDSPYQRILKLFSPLLRRGEEDLKKEGIQKANIMFEKYLDMRYQGQSYEIMIPFSEDFLVKFHTEHEQLYGYKNSANKVEIVNLRLRARGYIDTPSFGFEKESGPEPPADAILDMRELVAGSQTVVASIVDREKLLAGNVCKGPMIIVEYSSTTFVPQGWHARVDQYMNLIIERKG